ncbi:MAG: NAD-dependent epimerase/dehydratase family protein [Bacteroidota bacterium]
MKLLVTGGTGFIGSQICRLAAESGHTVISIARRGRPNVSDPWTHWVHWRAADVFDTTSWAADLEGCDAVIHCVGVVQEDPKAGVTFERLNGDSLVAVADAAQAHGVPKIVFVSAAHLPPFVSDRYLFAKRRAEAYLRQLEGVDYAVLRPSLVYGAERPPTVPLARLAEGMAQLPFVGHLVGDVLPLAVTHVAAGALQSALDPTMEGIFSIQDIQRMAATYHPLFTPDPRPGVATLAVTTVLVGAALGLWRWRREA